MIMQTLRVAGNFSKLVNHAFSVYSMLDSISCLSVGFMTSCVILFAS